MSSNATNNCVFHGVYMYFEVYQVIMGREKGAIVCLC